MPNAIRIWVDADACPKPIKEILFRAAQRRAVALMIVSNHALQTPPSLYIKKIQLGAGFDVVDSYIVEQLQSGDLVITADIPLADAVVSKGGLALNPRGTLYSQQNIKQCLGVRNMNDVLRGSGMLTGGHAPMNTKDIQFFSNQLDKWVTHRKSSFW
jgi:hypothetical protein